MANEQQLLHRHIDRLKRLVQQRTACLDAVRSAYLRDVLSVKDFLQQKRVAGGVSVSATLPVPEEIKRAPSVDLRRFFRGIAAEADVDGEAAAAAAAAAASPRPKGMGSRGAAARPPSVAQDPHTPARPAGDGNWDGDVDNSNDGFDEEVRVEGLSLRAYAPSSHALVIKPCRECLGVVAFVYRRNRRVDEALTRLDCTERLEGEVAALSAARASLLDRALAAEARLEVAARRLKEAEGCGKNGRDWLVKELARVVLEADALKADSLRQKQALLEGHRKMDIEKRQLRDEAEATAGRFRDRLAREQEELETLQEALLQSNAEARGEATKAFELEKQTRALDETVRRVEEGLRSRGRSLAEARRRAGAAEEEAALLRGRLRAAKEEAVEQELNAGNRLHEMEVALEAEGAEVRHLTARLDRANAATVALRDRVAAMAADAEAADRKRSEDAAAAATAAAATPRPPPSPSPQPPPPSPNHLASSETGAAAFRVESRSTQTDGGAAVEGSLDGANSSSSSVTGGGGDGGPKGAAARVRLAARACGLGVKRGLALAAATRGSAAGSAAEEGGGRESTGRAEEEDGGVPSEASASASATSTRGDCLEGSLEGGGGGGGEGGGGGGGEGTTGRGGAGAGRFVVRVWKERARVAEARLEALERAAEEYAEEASRTLSHETAKGRRRAEALAAAADVDGLRSAVDQLAASVFAAAAAAPGGGAEEDGGDAPPGRVGGAAAAAAAAAAAGARATTTAATETEMKKTTATAGLERSTTSQPSTLPWPPPPRPPVMPIAAAAAEDGAEPPGTEAGGVVRASGGTSGSDNRCSDDGEAAAAGAGDRASAEVVGEAVRLLIARLAEAREGVVGLRAQLGNEIKKTKLGREIREAERVRTAKLVNSLRSEAAELRRRPRSSEAGAQTSLTGGDLRETEAFVQALRKEHEGVELAFEMFREDTDRKRELASLKAEEDALQAEDLLHASHAYCHRLEGRVDVLMRHRETLQEERQVLRAAVRASFQDAAVKNKTRPVGLRTVATQVKCSVCAVRGELGAGDDGTAAGSATAAVAAMMAAVAATRPRTPGDQHKRAASAAAATVAASTRLPPPGKAWRRPGLAVDGLATASPTDTDKGGRRVPRTKESGGGGGGGNGEGGAKPNGRIPGKDGNGRCPKPAVPRQECCGGVVEGGSHPGALASALGPEEEEEEKPHPEYSSSSSTSLSSSTSGVLVRRGLKAGEEKLKAPVRRRRRLRASSQSVSGSSPLPCPGSAVGAVERGNGQDSPLAVVAARVQQQRFACVGGQGPGYERKQGTGPPHGPPAPTVTTRDDRVKSLTMAAG